MRQDFGVPDSVWAANLTAKGVSNFEQPSGREYPLAQGKESLVAGASTSACTPQEGARQAVGGWRAGRRCPAPRIGALHRQSSQGLMSDGDLGCLEFSQSGVGLGARLLGGLARLSQDAVDLGL